MSNKTSETRIHWANECDRTAFWEVRMELAEGELAPGRAEILGMALLAAVKRCAAGESAQWFPRRESDGAEL